MTMTPFVRHMLLCEEVRIRGKNARKFDVLGLLSVLHPLGEFPLRLSFTVFIQSTGGRGTGRGCIQVIEADTGEVLHDGEEHLLVFSPDPTDIHAATFRIVSCTFDRPGLYLVHFMYNGEHVTNESLLIKEPS